MIPEWKLKMMAKFVFTNFITDIDEILATANAILKKHIADKPEADKGKIIETKKNELQKLERRYEDSGLEKDYRALMNAKDRYEDNILELMHTPVASKLEILAMSYDLEAMIINHKNTLEWEKNYV
jgi:hypothetical protein